MNVFYFHLLNLSFTSAQTIQVIRDYTYLAKTGVKVFLYGHYGNSKELENVLSYVNKADINLSFLKKGFATRTLLKILFFKHLTKHIGNLNIVVIRDCGYKKINNLVWYKKIYNSNCNLKILLELHEGGIPHLIKNKSRIKKHFWKTIQKVDGIIFTNYSQVWLWKKEFGKIPKAYEVLPNGVEIERFSFIKRGNRSDFKVLTYIGQFTKWKNVELIFAALSLLDKHVILNIAGGKNDKASNDFISNMIQKYNLRGRVNYLGFVSPDRVPEILSESDVLLLPLGNNIQSKYLTSPMKLFEYMATGIPIVSIDYPSVSMIAKDCVFLASRPTPEEFAKAINEALYNEKQIRYKTMKAKEIVPKYSYENRAQRYKTFIERIIT